MKLRGGMLRLGRSVRGVRWAGSRTVCRLTGLARERGASPSRLARGVALKTSHVVNGQAVCASVFRRAWWAGGAIEVSDRVRLLVLVGWAAGASVSR